MTQLFEMSFEFDYYLNLSVLLLSFCLQYSKNVESIILCISYHFLMEKYLTCCMLKTTVIGVIDKRERPLTSEIVYYALIILWYVSLIFFQKKQPNLTRTVENIQINEEDNEIRYFVLLSMYTSKLGIGISCTIHMLRIPIRSGSLL